MKPSRKAFAYLLRRNSYGAPQLLVLSFALDSTMPLRLPGGTLHDGEDPFAGLIRELREEVGLGNVSVIRKLGIRRYYKEYIRADVERHDYLLQAPEGLPESFSHVVQGEGGDAGEVFDYRWISSEELDRVDWEFRKAMTPDYIPEFFAR